jgi:hypothetical protein
MEVKPRWITLCIYDYIEPVTSDRSLEAVSQQMGIDINSDTAIPNWHEGRMDLDMAVSGLYDLVRIPAMRNLD